jgi:hypothetical protein
LVTVEPPSTEKLAAVPMPTVAVAPRALVANKRVEISPSTITPARAVRAPENAERRLAARESREGDSSICGTPRFMGVSSLRR